MLQSMQMPNQGLPDVIRVQALRGFRGFIDGQFGIANPGDVVEVPRALAMEMRACGRAVMTDKEKHRAKDYLPERKRNGAPADPMAAQVAALTSAVKAMQEGLAAQGKAMQEAVAALTASKGKA